MNKRVKAVRQATIPKLNQWDFGARIGLSQSQYSAIENGKVRPNNRLIKLICTEFNVNENWLRTGNGEMFKNSFKSDFDKELEGLDILSHDETELIWTYRQLKTTGQDDVRHYADEKLELQQARESKNEEKITTIQTSEKDIQKLEPLPMDAQKKDKLQEEKGDMKQEESG